LLTELLTDFVSVFILFSMATQLRVNESTHATIRNLAQEFGESMQSIVEKAIERYKRELFLESLNEDFKHLRENEEAWNEELDERRLWENTLTDGVEE
jgi:hypothetical protein